MASSLKKEMQMQEFNVSELGSKVWDPSLEGETGSKEF